MPSKRVAAPKKPAASRAATSAAPKPARAARVRTAVKSSPAETTPMISHHDIAARAHDLYVQSGFQGHREVEFWLEAERQLKSTRKL